MSGYFQRAAEEAEDERINVAIDKEARQMFVARLQNMQTNGDRWLTVEDVLALLNDCDMLASRQFR